MIFFQSKKKNVDFYACAITAVMKRKANKRPVKVDWKYCFIQQIRQKKDITDTDDTLKTVANNLPEYRNLGELDLDWNAIMETVGGNGNPTSSSTLYESFEEKSSVFPQNLWIKVQQTKAQAASKKT